MWMMPLHLHVNQKSDYDDDDERADYMNVLLLIVDWLYGAHNGIVGYFPAEYIRPLARHEVERTPSMRVSIH